MYGNPLTSGGILGGAVDGPRVAVKRLFDLVVAASALLLLAPVIALIAVAIKLDDGGPVLFAQQRVGRRRQLFRCLKFRTMIPGAEWMPSGLAVTADDPRLSRVGRVLRLWTLDEIPQLLNVIRGDMSIVGPRPWVPSQTAPSMATGERRFDVRPGMAGWAWIHGRNRLSWEERARLDAWYVEHWSPSLDIYILARAFLVLLRRDGVYADKGDRVAVPSPQTPSVDRVRAASAP